MPAPLASLLAPDVLLDLFDALPETMFYVKDTRGRYVTVNRTMLDRSGLSRREDVLNRTAADLFPGALGENYTRDDLLVIARGEAIRDRLEMYHPQRGRGASVNVGWCLTHKLPLRDPSGVVVGLAGVSRDLPRPDERSQTYAQVASVAARVRASPGEPLRVPDLAREAGLSADQLERATRQVFGLTPKQLLMKARLEAASSLLRSTDLTVAEIAHGCGYSDHSAFTRQFRAAVGLTPSQYRALGGAQGAYGLRPESASSPPAR